MKKYVSPLRSRESLGARVFYTFVFAVLLVSSTLTLFFALHEVREEEAELLKKGKTLADLLAYSSKVGVFSENRALLEDAVRGVTSQTDVLEVSVYGMDGRMLLFEENSQGHGKNVEVPDPLVPSALETLSDPGQFAVSEEKERIIFLKPVSMELPTSAEELYFAVDQEAKRRVVIGFVRVVVDREPVKRELLIVLKRSIAAAALTFLVGSMIVLFVVRKVVRPLENLTAKVRLFGTGGSIESVSVESKDEIGKLAEAFNLMTENLKMRDEEKREVEEKLVHSRKMEAVGRLARGVAHDFNNILATVQGSVYLLKKRLEDEGQEMHYAEQISISLAKLKSLIQGLLTFSQTQTARFNAIDVNQIIRKLTPVLDGLAGATIEVRTILAPERLMIKGDALQIEQVLMNLCTNARDAMPDGGILMFRTAMVRAGAVSRSPLLTKSGPYALISAKDNGTGIDPETKEKMFEPFFSTKPRGKGTGLGLSIVFGIVEQHGGQIEAQTEIGKGTEFLIYLPLPGETEEPHA